MMSSVEIFLMFVMMLLVLSLIRERSIILSPHQQDQEYIILPNNQPGGFPVTNLVIYLQDQIASDAIAVVIVNPADGVTGNTTATTSSPAGDYPIIVGGCYFNPNYRIVFQ